jgi:hypothetical protein
MKLQHLEIRLIPSYATDNPGLYKAEIQFEDKSGKVTMALDPDVSTAILEFIGPVLTKFSLQTSRKMEDAIRLSLEEVKKLPQIEAKAEALPF